MTVVLHYTADLAPEVQDSAFSWNGLQAVSYVFIGEFSLWYQNWVTISAVIGSSYYVSIIEATFLKYGINNHAYAKYCAKADGTIRRRNPYRGERTHYGSTRS
ncbi:hypothetical protein C8Q69DRAFT_442090 [Paecilomyces variotii]|uniref:Uncharacterized protein n=1 Tax=Byssochlamys spectabilis TaxID=264951 RepID=A0A443I1K1_BYSSP|nr:hypothetical protein C8Q69DRAFT_442090 [Paecilomyces variotii]RWQ97911.1 hypothetical protein C8Q69DRAFT_442090 [Paecilomyces variotii]